MTTETISLENLTDAEYEALAKRIADSIAEHDTLSDNYRRHQRHHSGEIFYRMSMGSRIKAHALLKDMCGSYVNNWAKLVQDEDFADYVLAFLCGGGLDVEWRKD